MSPVMGGADVVGERARRRSYPLADSAEFRLRATAAAPATARDAVRDVLVSWGLTELCDTAMLLCSELVTNAVRHAGTRLSITLQRLPRGLRVAVADAAGEAWPRLTNPADTDEGGRGLWLVDKLASSWGTTGDGGGKTVWFELVAHESVSREAGC